MTYRFLNSLINGMYNRNLIKRQETSRRFVYGFLYRNQPKMSRLDAERAEKIDAPQVSSSPDLQKKADYKSELSKHSIADDLSDGKWTLELAWLTKALEQALQLWNGLGNKTPAGRSVSEIISSIQRSKIGIEGWSLSDLTVQDLIYHLELAKGPYKGSAFWLARNSMLRESNILKFVNDSSVMRPGYYVAIDPRRKLVILGIRGTHIVYDLITDIISSSDGEVTFEGYSSHFGTAEAARWFLNHEMGTIRLRLVGHSLGAATASLLAIMLRKRTFEELGFNADIVTAVGYATPPCVSRKLAEGCADFVTTIVMQDDIIPRLSAASLTRLRNEILQTDWMSVIEKEDWKSVVGLVTNAKQVVSSVQDVARKLADYAKFSSKKNIHDSPISNSLTAPGAALTSKTATTAPGTALTSRTATDDDIVPEELFVPGTVYYLKRNTCSRNGGELEYFTLWKRHPSEHFQMIVLSSNIISDHKCDSHYYALRDVDEDTNTSDGLMDQTPLGPPKLRVYTRKKKLQQHEKDTPGPGTSPK